MATTAATILYLESGGTPMQFYLNDKGEIFASPTDDTAGMFFFVITKEDWAVMKEFIDTQISE